MPADGTNAAVKSQDIGTSGWELADKATLLARIGKGGGAMSPPGTYRSSTEGRSGSAFGTRADQVFLGPSVWAATIPVSILIISVRFRSIAVVGRSRRVLWRRVFRSGRRPEATAYGSCRTSKSQGSHRGWGCLDVVRLRGADRGPARPFIGVKRSR